MAQGLVRSTSQSSQTRRRFRVFNSSTVVAAGTLFSQPTKVDVLAVGGGGGGGNSSVSLGTTTSDGQFGGGGGAGGAVIERASWWVNGNLTVTVGNGGAVVTAGGATTLSCDASLGVDSDAIIAPGGECGGVPSYLGGRTVYTYYPVLFGPSATVDLTNPVFAKFRITRLNQSHVPLFGLPGPVQTYPLYTYTDDLNPGDARAEPFGTNGILSPFYRYNKRASRNPGRGTYGGSTGGFGGGLVQLLDDAVLGVPPWDPAVPSAGLAGGVFGDGASGAAPTTQFPQPFGCGGGGGAKGNNAAGGAGSYGAGNGASSNGTATAGAPNTGGGGGGASAYQAAAAGGSGLVIISWDE